MSKNYFANEIGSALSQLATGEGVLRERIEEALPHIASAHALKEPFFKKEFDQVEFFFETISTKDLDSVSDEDFKKVAVCILDIYAQLPEFLNKTESAQA